MASLFNKIYLFKLRYGPVYKFPPRIIWAAVVVPFVNINRIGAKAFDLILNIHFEAVYRSQHAYNAKDSERNSNQRQGSAQLIYPEFLHGKPE